MRWVKKRKLLSHFTGLVLFIAFSSVVFAQTTQVELVFAVTSDLHGWLTDRTMFHTGKARGLLHIADSLIALRKKHPHLILLDAGDTLQGSPDNYYFNHVKNIDRPLPIVSVMNALQYDAIALGNHDLEPPLEVFEKNRKYAAFPWLSANFLNESGLPHLSPFQIIERRGIRVAILGLLTPGTQMWINSSHLEGYTIEDMVESAKHWGNYLKDEAKVDVLVGLFHSGHTAWYDRYAALNEGVPLPNAAGLIADTQPQFDLILSGHAHRTYPRSTTSLLRNFKTPLVSPGAHGNGVSLISLTMEKEKHSWKIEKKTFQYLKASPDLSQSMQALVAVEREQVEQYLNEETSVSFKALPNKEIFYQCGSALSHLALEVQQGKKVYSMLPGQWKWNSLSMNELGKPVTRRHLFRWIRYDNTLVQANLYGRQIEILLETKQRAVHDLRIRVNSLLQPGGFHLDLIEPRKTIVLFTNSNPQKQVLPAVQYPVWLTNYHWNGGTGLMGKALVVESQKINELPIVMRDMIWDYLNAPTDDLPPTCQSFLRLSP